MSRLLLSLCLSIALFMPVLGSMINDNAGHFLTLPLSIPFGIYRAGGPEASQGIPTYSFIVILDGPPGTESYEIQTSMCGGACSVFVQTYSGSGTVTDSNYLHRQTNPGLYMVVFRIPPGQYLSLSVWYFKTTDNTTTPVTTQSNLLVFTIDNPAPYVSSSTGPAVVWPDGRGPVGLSIEDGVSSSLLPRASGWSWTEYDRDLSTYTFRVGFVARLMEYDGFWINPSFGDATLLSMTRNTDGNIVAGNYLGSWDNPIRADYSSYAYQLHIPYGGTSEVTLHYVYRIPGETQTQNQTVYVDIGNYYGIDRNQPVRHALNRRVQQQIEVPDVPVNESAPSVTVTVDEKSTGEQPVSVESINTNSASSMTSVHAFALVMCGLIMAL